jgi:hypothetical protein
LVEVQNKKYGQKNWWECRQEQQIRQLQGWCHCPWLIMPLEVWDACLVYRMYQKECHCW